MQQNGFTALPVIDVYESFCKARGGIWGTWVKRVLAKMKKYTPGLVRVVLSPVVYGKLSFGLGCDFVASFVWITKLYMTAIIFPSYLKSHLSSTKVYLDSHHKSQMQNWNCLQVRIISPYSFFCGCVVNCIFVWSVFLISSQLFLCNIIFKKKDEFSFQITFWIHRWRKENSSGCLQISGDVSGIGLGLVSSIVFSWLPGQLVWAAPLCWSAQQFKLGSFLMGLVTQEASFNII